MDKDILDLFRMGYVLAYEKSGLFGNLIEKRQLLAGFTPDQARFCHVEISGGGVHSVYIRPPMSKLVAITEAHNGQVVRVLRYKNEDYECKGRYKVGYFSATLCNKPYDVKGILAFVFKWIKQSKGLAFCSEGCLSALRMEYPEIMPRIVPDKCFPAHFVASDEFETVWEGKIE